MTFAAALLVLAVTPAGRPVVAPLPDGDRVEWRRGEAPARLALPKQGEGWAAMAARLTDGAGRADALRQLNDKQGNPQRGVPVRVSLGLLRPELRVAALRALFPDDRRVGGGYVHVLRAPWGGDGESWWELAEWFCGSGEQYPALRLANPELGLFPPRGARLLIPGSALLPAFAALKVEAVFTPAPAATPVPARAATPALVPTSRPSPAPDRATPAPMPTPTPALTLTSTPALTLTSTPAPAPTLSPAPEPTPEEGEGEEAALFPTPGPSPRPSLTPAAGKPAAREEQSASKELIYRGEEAIYRLKPGEALYSAVVVRFTGQLHAADVNAMAAELARRSGIADVTQIPVGYPVHIPLNLLLPEFLPPGHPGRVAWEKDRAEIQAIKRAIRAANLDGIHVILDAGHGGGDTGAVVEDVWESAYVYDVMGRLKRVLQNDTRATVWTTVRDSGSGDGPAEKDELPQHRGQSLLVDPAYDLSDSFTGVHLRWVLANDILERLGRQKVNPERVAFISIHADSLHPSLRGMMVYVPSKALRAPRGPALGSLYDCREMTSYKPPRFPAAFNARAEALSTQLGEAIVGAATKWSVPVHPYQPVRGSVRRGGGTWVPAVLKYSRVPTAVLVEICNLNNEADRGELRTVAYREKLAHAIAAGLAEAFSR